MDVNGVAIILPEDKLGDLLAIASRDTSKREEEKKRIGRVRKVREGKSRKRKG